ncbi:MAG: hypothetical protein J5605_03125 [Bacteroidales bacterium]|nr:hypothetical protein [Bacteroidales bacterium]
MGMFYTPSPRRFTYKPRFYSEEKEELEILKAKYANKKNDHAVKNDDELNYYRDLVESFDKKDDKSVLSGLLKRKKVPQFSYKPRFSENSGANSEGSDENRYNGKINIKKAMDERHTSYSSEPVPASRIFIYAAIVSIIVLWILFGNFEKIVEVFTNFGAEK